MAAKKVSKQSATVERVFDHEKIDYYYSNCALIRTTIPDFTFNFGTIFHDDKNNKITEVYEKAIYMSPQQAKLLFNSLKGLMENYENTFGEIKVAPKKK